MECAWFVLQGIFLHVHPMKTSAGHGCVKFLRWAAVVSIHNGYSSTTVYNPLSWESLYYRFGPSRLSIMVLHLNHVQDLIIITSSDNRYHFGFWSAFAWWVLGSWLLQIIHIASSFCLAKTAVLKKVSWLPTLITKVLVFQLPRLYWLSR